MRRLGLAAGLVVLTAGGTVPSAANPFSAAFVETFRETCVPERLSYEGTLANAQRVGWTTIEPAASAEFGAVMAKSAEGLEEARAEGIAIGFQSGSFARTVDGRTLNLVVSLAESEYLNEIGCYLYDLDPTEAVDAAAVSAMLGLAAPAQSMRTGEIVSHVWGPPPAMPRTLDTHLTFIPAGSPHVAEAGFDGVVLKFTTSAPDGEG